MQIVSEFENNSTDDSSANNSAKASSTGNQAFGEQYIRIEAMLAAKFTGEASNSQQRILVESSFTNLQGGQDSLFQIPCFVSKDNSTFFAFINNLEAEKFSKTALFNLVDTAESNHCERIVFIVLKDTPQFEAMQDKLEIIDAFDMSHEQVQTILDPQAQDADNFTFFELMM